MSLFRTDIMQLVITNKSDFDFLWWEGKNESDSPEEMVDEIRDNLALTFGISPLYLEHECRIALNHYIISYKDIGTIHVITRGNYNRWKRCWVL